MNVVIIGAGAAGLGIGWQLARQGATVTVLERAQYAHGAIWAAAGMIAPVGEGMEGPLAQFGQQSSQLWPDFAATLEAQSGVSIGYARKGALLVAADGDEAAHLARRAEREEDLQLLNASQAVEREPLLTPLIAGAAFAQDEAQVDTRALGHALARALIAAGGTIIQNEAVVRIEVSSGRAVAARTPFRLHEADAFVIAAGAWSSGIDGLPPGTVPQIKPIKGEAIAYAVPSDAATLREVVWGKGVYLVPRGRRILAGASVADVGFDTSLTKTVRAFLQEHATALIPALAQWRVDEHWAGLRPASPDGLPVLGRSQVDGLFVASGQYRNGILFTPVLADVMARTVMTGALPPEHAAFDIRRFA